MRLNGVLTAGYQVDSGTSTRDTRFPLGTLRMQAPFFSALGMDFEQYFDGDFVWGSLNMDIHPLAFNQVKSDFFFQSVHWTDLQPAENFFMSKATAFYDGREYKMLIYNPDPRTKPNHFQLPSIMQLIGQRIPNISYGAQFDFEIPDGHFEFTELKGEKPAPLKNTAAQS